MIQRVDCHDSRNGSGAGCSRATCDGEARLTRAEFTGNSQDDLFADIGLSGDARRRIRSERRRPFVAIATAIVTFADNCVRNPQREQSLSTRLRRNPLVGIGAGQRHAWFDLYRLATPTVSPLPQMSVSETVVNRGKPRTQIVRTERQHEIGVLDVVVRQLVYAERNSIGCSYRAWIGKVILLVMLRSQQIHELRKKLVQVSPDLAAQQPDATGVALDFEPADATSDRRERFVPAYFDKFSGLALSDVL